MRRMFGLAAALAFLPIVSQAAGPTPSPEAVHRYRVEVVATGDRPVHFSRDVVVIENGNPVETSDEDSREFVQTQADTETQADLVAQARLEGMTDEEVAEAFGTLLPNGNYGKREQVLAAYKTGVSVRLTAIKGRLLIEGKEVREGKGFPRQTPGAFDVPTLQNRFFSRIVPAGGPTPKVLSTSGFSVTVTPLDA